MDPQPFQTTLPAWNVESMRTHEETFHIQATKNKTAAYFMVSVLFCMILQWGPNVSIHWSTQGVCIINREP